jgi:hypothetical protein
LSPNHQLVNSKRVSVSADAEKILQTVIHMETYYHESSTNRIKYQKTLKRGLSGDATFTESMTLLSRGNGNNNNNRDRIHLF